MSELTRTYICPKCGYDGFKMSEPRSTFADINFHPGCPACATIRSETVMLVETSDPREIADQQEGQP